jgi:hypothetical protein
MRRIVSDDQFMLSQLDGNFETSYGKFQSAMTGFLRGWTQGAGKRMVVDKNRAWLHCIELLLHLAPEARLLVCVRELGQIYGSIEAQHQNTILLDFIDHLADYDRFGRADVLFAKDKAIGAPLIIYESGRIVTGAFRTAALLALAAITRLRCGSCSGSSIGLVTPAASPPPISSAALLRR